MAVGGRAEVLAQEAAASCARWWGSAAGRALLMPFGALDGIGLGCKVEMRAPAPARSIPHRRPGSAASSTPSASRSTARGRCRKGPVAYPLRDRPPPAHARKRVQGKIDLGVRALNTFLTCCRGQRMGIFSGSGVGKSVLMSMIARYTAADATVIGLVGERGREVQEFIEDDLGPEGLARSIVVVATSDELPLMRRQAAHLTLARRRIPARPRARRAVPHRQRDALCHGAARDRA